MKGKEINILEFPSNLGLKKTDQAPEPGVVELPKSLKAYGLHDRVQAKNTVLLSSFSYTIAMDGESGVRNADKIICYAREQSCIMGKYLTDDSFQLILGGDCSILIGVALGLKKKGNYGLFFIDGHTDFMDPSMSGTGGAAGMDLSIVTGHGHPKLTDMDGQKPYFDEKNVFCVGNREHTPGYEAPILNSGITYLDLDGLRSNGLEKTSLMFLDMVGKRGLDGFFIHFDVDVLNNEIMPLVDSPQVGGLYYEELSELLIPLLSSPMAVGMEITILDPTLDKEDGHYTKEFIGNFMEIVQKARNPKEYKD